MRLSNPVDLLLGNPAPERLMPNRALVEPAGWRDRGPRGRRRLPPGYEYGEQSREHTFPPKPPRVERHVSPVRATHGTERARRLIRKIAVALYGRGKTVLEYRYGHWFVNVHGPDGFAVASFVAVDRQPGMFNTGIDLVPAP